METLMIIKPDGVERKLIGKILAVVEEHEFTITGLKMVKLTEDLAEEFYSIHKGKPFFNELIEYMTSGKSVFVVLEKENAIHSLRELIGKTDPEKAKNRTIRHIFGVDITHNTVHASDSEESAKREIDFFRNKLEKLCQ